MIWYIIYISQLEFVQYALRQSGYAFYVSVRSCKNAATMRLHTRPYWVGSTIRGDWAVHKWSLPPWWISDVGFLKIMFFWDIIAFSSANLCETLGQVCNYYHRQPCSPRKKNIQKWISTQKIELHQLVGSIICSLQTTGNYDYPLSISNRSLNDELSGAYCLGEPFTSAYHWLPTRLVINREDLWITQSFTQLAWDLLSTAINCGGLQRVGFAIMKIRMSRVHCNHSPVESSLVD